MTDFFRCQKNTDCCDCYEPCTDEEQEERFDRELEKADARNDEMKYVEYEQRQEFLNDLT